MHLDHGTDFDLIMRRDRFYLVMSTARSCPMRRTSRTARGGQNRPCDGRERGGRTRSDARRRTGTAQAAPVSDLKPEDCYTDPDTAKDFVDRTGVDALAIPFGTAHGIYTAQPKLDFSVIERVRANVGGLPSCTAARA